MEAVTITNKKLGKGSWGSVFAGSMVKDGKTIRIAVKKLENDGSGNVFPQNARKEYDILCSVGEHENIIQLLGFYSDRQFIYILTELGAHGDLEKYLMANHLELHDKLKIMHGCADGLKFMHSRPVPIVHRDIKPENVIIQNSPGGGVVAKMCDFGLSRLFDPDGKQIFMSTYVGTYMYLAPEFFASEKLQYTVAIDSFALGLLFLAVFLFNNDDKCLEPNPEIFRKTAKLAYGQRLCQAKCEHRPPPVMFTLSPDDSLTEMQLKMMMSSMTSVEASDRMAIGNVECILRKMRTAVPSSLQETSKITQLKAEVKDLVRRNHLLKDRVTSQQATIQTSKDSETSKDTVILEMQKHVKQLEFQVSELRMSQKEQERLATEMNDKVASGLIIPCRPMNVADAYQNVCSNEWLDAKDFVSQKLDEEPSCILLRDVMLICESESALLLDGLMHLEEYPIQGPVQHYSNLGDHSLSKSKLDDYRRSVAKLDLQYLFKKCKEGIAKQNPNLKAVICGKPVNEYIESVARITWKMVIQQPQMEFSIEGEGQKYCDTIQELQWGSNPVGKYAKVKYYVYPMLYHGDKLMTKGKVLVL